MDAKPQRPVRALHAVMDENAVIPLKQFAHQRLKPTGNMLVVTGGGLKTAAKRTALNEVSNVSKAIARDEPQHTGKTAGTLLVKPPVVSDKLYRPTQKSASQLGVKTDSTDKENHQSSIYSTSAQYQPIHNKTSISQPKAHTSGKQNRAAVIYKDDSHERLDVVLSTNVPAFQNTVQCQHNSEPRLAKETLSQGVDKLVDSDSFPNIELGENVMVQLVNEAKESVPIATDASVAADLNEKHKNIAHQNEQRATTYMDSKKGQVPSQSAVTEQEESWGEEDEYDDQGYTTTQAVKFRNDNFTSGSTTVVFPQIDSHAQDELAEAKQFVELNRSDEEIDDEAWDTTMVAEYGEEIFAYMRELELKMMPNPHYMEDQSEIQWSMRAVLMDWLVQVHRRFGLLPETLFLCVNYIDRFLSNKIVSLGKLQLVGATAIFVAAKYEEINCPSVAEIVYMVDGGYTVDEILKAERFMLSMLQFELGWPGPMSFLRRISKADDYDVDTRTLAKYFLEVTIMDERFVAVPPSYTAAGSHCVARLMLGRGTWSKPHVHYSGYTYVQLSPLLDMMVDCLREPDKHHGAVFEKYTDRRFKCASLFVAERMRHDFVLPHHHSRVTMQRTSHDYMQRHHMLSSSKN